MSDIFTSRLTVVAEAGTGARVKVTVGVEATVDPPNATGNAGKSSNHDELPLGAGSPELVTATAVLPAVGGGAGLEDSEEATPERVAVLSLEERRDASVIQLPVVGTGRPPKAASMLRAKSGGCRRRGL